MDGRTLGIIGEKFAENYYRDKGYRIKATNYRCRFGEIDIIAHGQGYYVFVEVKARSDGFIFLPAEAVTAGKQKKIIKTAEAFLAENSLSDPLARFDVCEVFFAKNGRMKLHCIENAFP